MRVTCPGIRSSSISGSWSRTSTWEEISAAGAMNWAPSRLRLAENSRTTPSGASTTVTRRTARKLDRRSSRRRSARRSSGSGGSVRQRRSLDRRLERVMGEASDGLLQRATFRRKGTLISYPLSGADMFHRACCVAACLFAGAAGSASPALPLTKLRLYDTGVAYYERSGRLDARGATLPVPTGHLDDVLKTLVVLSHDGGRIGGVEFASSVSKGMARTLAGLPAEADAPIGYPDLLQSLKGTHVLVTTAKERFAARLVDAETVETEQPAPPEEKADKDRPPAVVHTKELMLLLLTDASEVRRLKARDVLSLRPTDPGFSARLGAALDALSSHGAQSERSLRVSGSSKAVTLGYIAEAALWRTTYRLVIGPGEQTVLQGWALLHNDTDEDWNGVRVELVNGQPDSFLYPLAAPRYASRPLVTPQNELSTVPQLLDTTVDALWGDHSETSGTGSGGGGYGSGFGLGSIGTVGHGAGISVSDSNATVSASDELQVGNLANVEEAEGVEAGELFTYKLPEPLTLKARGSALVPFLQRRVTAERISWCATASDPPRAGVRLVNSTDQTLPGGPLSVFAEGGFSGEATIDRLKPRE